jgi:hypothetical protein
MNVLRKYILLLIFNILCLPVAYAQTEVVKGKEPAEMGIVTGKIESEDKALVFGYIGFFSTSGRMPDPTRFWRTPDHVFILDKEWRFNAQLPDGAYYAIAIKKQRKDFGPLEPDDHFFYFMDDAGPMRIVVKKGEKLDLGLKKTAAHSAFLEIFNRQTEGITAIKGIIKDEKGSPVPDLFVGAYTRPVMLGKPDYISRRSDKDGRYEIRLSDGGNYYLVARYRLGSPPAPGDFYGRVGDEKNPLSIKTGEVLEINIKVHKVQ